MNVRGAMLMLGLLLVTAAVHALPPGRTLSSISKQFVVSSSIVTPSVPLTPPSTVSPTNIVHLSPGRLVLAADRVKTLFLRQLRSPDTWSGGIRLHLEPGAGQPAMTRRRYSDGWQYSATIPEQIRAIDLVRLLTDLLLAEYAERFSDREVPPPLWLRVGLAEIIYRAGGPSLLTPRGVPVVIEGRMPDPYLGTRELLLHKAPLGYADLSLPTRTHLRGANWEHFRASAHLFTRQLLQRREGHRELHKFIRLLPRFKNSQFAFLNAYQLGDPKTGTKTTLLDVEKWWTIARTQFRSRDRSNNWSTERSLAQLKEALHVIPATGQPIPLQQRLGELDLAAQRQQLENTLFRLKTVAVNAPPGMQSLIRDYYNTLNDYYRKRRLGPGTTPVPAPNDPLARSTIRQLNLLDTIMADVRQLNANTAFGKTVSPPRP